MRGRSLLHLRSLVIGQRTTTVPSAFETSCSFLQGAETTFVGRSLPSATPPSSSASQSLLPAWQKMTAGLRTSAICCNEANTPVSPSQNSRTPASGLRSPDTAPPVGLQPRAAPVQDASAALRYQMKKVGTIYVVSTKNNTICTLVDMKGLPVATTSAGAVGFKNARKSTTYAAQATAERIVEKAMEKGYFQARIVMKGIGSRKLSAVRALAKSNLKILELHEHTAMPHNGCRAPRRRRV